MKWLHGSELRQIPRGGLKAWYRKAEEMNPHAERHTFKSITRFQRVLQVFFYSVVLRSCIRARRKDRHVGVTTDSSGRGGRCNASVRKALWFMIYCRRRRKRRGWRGLRHNYMYHGGCSAHCAQQMVQGLSRWMTFCEMRRAAVHILRRSVSLGFMGVRESPVGNIFRSTGG